MTRVIRRNLRILGVTIVAFALQSCAKEMTYQGDDTLANYPNLKTLESELAKDVLLEAIGFWDKDKDTQLVTAEQMVEITAFLYLGLHTNWVHDVDTRSMNIRPTGPFINGTGYNTHQRARVYYSNEVVDWLVGGREGQIPDGAMIVKQMYPTDPKDTTYGGEKVTGWAAMIRDSSASKDGWLWYLFFFPGTPSYGSPVLLSQYGMSYCLACHSGTDNDSATFASINNLNGEHPTQYTTFQNPTVGDPAGAPPVLIAGHSSQPPSFGLHLKDVPALIKRVEEYRDSKHPELKAKIGKHLGDIPKELMALFDHYVQDQMAKPITPPLVSANPAIVSTFGQSPVAATDVKHLPWDLFTGHTTASADDLKTFVSSDNCRGCHDASLLLGGRQPNMMIYEDIIDPETGQPEVEQGEVQQSKYNIAVYGEWGTSMMGLAGRDPIFHAQLESEHALRPEIADWTSNLCLSCHQVAGQRQFHLDGNEGDFTSAYTYEIPETKQLNPKAVYGSLGRDGVTCLVCHQVTPEGLGKPETFTGKFNINTEPGKVYGPYPTEDIKPYYMQQALGIEPQFGSQIKDSALCGSCHTINLPVLPPGATTPPADDGPVVHEQTTYVEWLNSDFVNDPDKTCQGCHMPGNFRETPTLTTAIANVEDGSFPDVDNRAAADLITPDPKENYRRHTLVGLSVVANKMFQQFPQILGVTTLDPGTPLTYGPSAKGAIHRLALTEQEMGIMAAETVRLTTEVLEKGSSGWRVNVNIENLVGHKFPSGVGFRRAFLEVTARSANNDVIWASGATDKAGVILGANGQALPSEFTTDWRALQPDYAVIDSADQVLILENRHTNTDGVLTTSFLGLAKEVKDNRLLPRGWKPDGPYADWTGYHSLGGERANPSSPGSRTVEYRIPASAGNIDHVEVRLLYQSTPPYYLRDRFETKGPETDRLYYLASYVDLDGSIAENWSVNVAKAIVR